MSHAPTEEQQVAAGTFAAGVDLAVQAGAGCGKTTTLETMARSTPAIGTYMAFNRSIVNEAKEKMPVTCPASTVHGLGMRAIGGDYRHRLDVPRMKSWKLAELMGVPRKPLMVKIGDGRSKSLQAGWLASLVMRALKAFCQSADLEPTIEHIPYVEGIDYPEHGKRGHANNDLLRAHLAGPLARAWADLSSPAGEIPYNRDHGYYLKVWALGEPTIPGSFIMADECQDLSGVMLQILEHNQRIGRQIVLVGDTQQAIYGWAGCVNAFDLFRVDVEVYLSQSFRFGNAIAAVANAVLEQVDAQLRLIGRPGKDSSVGALANPSAVLCRSNAAALENVLRYQRAGKRPHLIGGGEDVLKFARAAADLKEGRETWHPDLACFESWGEVQAYVENDPQGSDLKLLVEMIEEYGIDIIVQALEGMIGERDADVVISTAHKAKGREWDTVRLAGDFQDPDGSAEEWRLLYVAATRAREVLDYRLCAPLVELLEGGSEPPQRCPLCGQRLDETHGMVGCSMIGAGA